MTIMDPIGPDHRFTVLLSQSGKSIIVHPKSLCLRYDLLDFDTYCNKRSLCTIRFRC